MFDKYPLIKVSGREEECFEGWQNIGNEIKQKLDKINKKKKIIVIETYQGVYSDVVFNKIKEQLGGLIPLKAEKTFYSSYEIENITYKDVTDDRIFGFLTRLNMEDFQDPQKVEGIQNLIEIIEDKTILIFGTGASILAPDPDLLIYADMPRWEIQQRFKRNEICNLGLNNQSESFETQYKRSFFIDWRVCDRLKKKLMHSWDYVLDTNNMSSPKLATGKAIDEGLRQAISQPFSLVPFFDPGPWGGQWMKEVCDLDREKENFAWCFNCIPEENSLLLQFGENIMEIPSINLVFKHPCELLGEKNYARFGDEFPIRFDFLDTMDGGNLSLQVHPLTEYIQEKFGMNYTQDESYYLMDAKKDAFVYLGLKENVDANQMFDELRKAEKDESIFNVDKYVEKWSAKKHDHFLIPAGTIHCSGKNSMVLEISATPYIFTFKLWDWGRYGMDGKPRPINIEHGKNSVQTNRTTNWAKENLVNQITEVSKGEGWREERTGLHELEFIETRRYWFTTKIHCKTNNGVHVLNLVEGDEIIIESPLKKFKPFVIHYAETFIVPSVVGEYTVRPYGDSEGKECVVIMAYVR